MCCSMKSEINSELTGWCSPKARTGWSLADFKTLFPLSAAQVALKNLVLCVHGVRRWLDSIGILGDVGLFLY